VNVSASPRTAVIMIVEDDSAIRLLCKVTLERAGRDRGLLARVVEAADLSSARRLLASDEPDLIVMDVRLPDGSGLDLARELRAGQRADDHGPRPSPQVIIASASVLPTERAEALGAGADRFLAKPYRPSELVDAVLDLVGEPSVPRSLSNSPSMTR
jgi:CheY-like chemotaxis protein